MVSRQCTIEHMIRFIVAVDEKLGIADEHGIPWQGKIPKDVEYYHEKIKTGIILMGYGLYAELNKPLVRGVNYVATGKKDAKLRPGFEPVHDAREFQEQAKEDVWNIGGAMLFASTIDQADELCITQLKGDFHCTKFFPEFKDKFELKSESEEFEQNGIKFRFQVWAKK